MTRKESREYMMKVFFQMEARKDFLVDHKEEYMGDCQAEGQQDYCDNLFSLLCNRKEMVDQQIAAHSTKWKISRIPKAELAILRVAVIELLYLGDIPASVSINEAVALAKLYGDDQSPAYINGILGAIAGGK